MSSPPLFRVPRTLLALLSAVLLLSGLEATSPSPAVADPTATSPMGIAGTATGNGYWIAARDGGVFSFGDAKFYGSMGGKPLNAPVVAIAATRTGHGYWLTAGDGGVFAFGDAQSKGSMAGQHLNAPVVGIAGTPDGGGYWLVAADGGIFAFGNAGFYGSMGGQPLNKPIVGIAATPSGAGYWLVAADGGIFAFGDAQYRGGMGGQALNAPIIGMARTGTNVGYREFGADGGVFAYGDATFDGSMAGQPLAASIVAADTHPGGGYWLLGGDGGVFAFGNARYYGRVVNNAPVPSSRAYTLVLPRSSVTVATLSAKHHNYPAVDIAVPVGTTAYAIVSGTITTFDQPTKCGWGIQLAGDDGGLYVYCHLSQRVVASGTRVTSGATLGKSGGAKGAQGAGDSQGPHLHLQLKYTGNTYRCPQNLLVALYNNTAPPALTSLPTSGCTS